MTRKPTPSSTRKNKPRYKAHILIARFSAMGDVAMTVPVLYSVARANPATLFTFMTKPGLTRMFINRPANLEVRGVEFPGDARGDIRVLRALVAELSSRLPLSRFVDLHDVLRTRVLGLICRLRGIPVTRFDKARSGKRALTRRIFRSHTPVRPTISRYARALGLTDSQITFTTIFPEGKGDPALFADVAGPRLSGERWIGIAPFARHQGKIYPAPLMREVIDDLAWQGRTRIFLFGGGKEEESTLRQWAADYDNVVCVAGSGICLEGELSLISHLDVMLSMDSANMHLAALTGTKVLSIWGATHPAAGFTPFDQSPDSFIQADGMKCRPCSVFGNRPCRHSTPLCMTAITPRMVVDRIRAAIS